MRTTFFVPSTLKVSVAPSRSVTGPRRGAAPTVSKAYYQNQVVENSWTQKRRPMSLTLDAGMCLNYGIWRFDLKLKPAIHF